MPVRQLSPDGISGAGPTVVAEAWVAEGAASHDLIIRLIIQMIRQTPIGASSRSLHRPPERGVDVGNGYSAVQAVETPEGVVNGQDLEPGEAGRGGPTGDGGGAQDRAGGLHRPLGQGGGQAVQDAPAVHEPLHLIAGRGEGLSHPFVGDQDGAVGGQQRAGRPERPTGSPMSCSASKIVTSSNGASEATRAAAATA